MVDLDEAWAALSRETNLSQKEWLDILALPEPDMRRVLATYKDADWTKPGTSAWKAVLAALPILGQVVGIASGVGMLSLLLKGGGPPPGAVP